jgi:hypothetical protein
MEVLPESFQICKSIGPRALFFYGCDVLVGFRGMCGAFKTSCLYSASRDGCWI